MEVPRITLAAFPRFPSRIPGCRQCSQPSGAPVGPGGGLPRARDEKGRQNIVHPHLSFLLVRQQLEKMTGRDDKMPSVLVLEFPRMAVIRKNDKPHDLRHILVGDGRGRQGVVEDGGKQRKTTENNGRRLKTAGDGGGRQGTVLHSDVGASSRKYRTGRQNAVRPHL